MCLCIQGEVTGSGCSLRILSRDTTGVSILLSLRMFADVTGFAVKNSICCSGIE